MKVLYRNTGDMCVSLGLLAVRLVVGAAFILHGWGKIQSEGGMMGWMGPSGPPAPLQAAAAIAEFGGGISLILGLLTPLFSFLLLCTMGFALFKVHIPAGDPFVAVNRSGLPYIPSWELAAVY